MEEKIEEVLKVFISYSWDSEQHKDWVLNLANKLTEEGGLYVILDRYDLKAGKTMTQFMEKAVNQSDKVLLIMTPSFKDKADERVGGVGYEYSMVSQELYERQDSNKFIPIRRIGSYDECAPKFLKQYISHDMTTDETFDIDFESLLRIIYDEPEIVRPPIGSKPKFVSKIQNLQTHSLIDETEDLQRSKMTTFAKWSISFKLESLEDQDTSSLFKLVSSNVLIDKDNKHALPFILDQRLKISHTPDVIYENNLRRYIAYNHLLHDKLLIRKGLIHYEFSEYNDHDVCLLFTSEPFSTLFYILCILKSIHNQIDKPINFKIQVSFKGNKRSMLYSKYSPFNYPFIYNMQKMIIPDNSADLTLEVTELTKDSIFRLFERLYEIFVDENPKSSNPFVQLDRDHFDMVTNEFLK